MIWHEDRSRVLAEIDKQVLKSDFDACQYRVEKKDGSLCWIYDVGYLHRDENGGEYYVILMDMTEQKKMEEENRRLTARLETVINSIPGAICLYHWDGEHLKALQVSSQLEEILGVDAKKALETDGAKMLSPVHPDDLLHARTETRKVLLEGKPMDTVFRVFHQVRGEYFWLRMQAVAKPQEDGTVLIYALYTDITESYRLRCELQEQRDMLAAAMEHSGMYSWIYEFPTKRIYWNQKTGEQQEQSETADHLPTEALKNAEIDAESAKKYQEMLETLRHNGTRAEADLKCLRSDTGEQRWKRIMYTVISRDANGLAERAIGTSLDVTEQKVAEQKYAEEAAYLNALSTSLVASYRINLNTGAVEEAHSSLHIVENAREMRFNDETFRALCARLIPLEKEREACYAAFRPAQLMRDYERGKAEKTLEYPAKLPGKHTCWLTLRAKVMRKPSTGELIVFFSFWNVNRQKLLQQVVEVLTKTEFEHILLVDAETGEAEIVRSEDGDDSVFAAQEKPTDSAEGLETYLRTVCVPEDVDRVMQETALPRVRKALERADLYSVHYPVHTKTGARMEKRVDYCYLDDEKTTILCVVQKGEPLEEQDRSEETS